MSPLASTALLVSCPRSSPYRAAGEGDQQATENKEPVSRTGRQSTMANFRFGTLACFLAMAACTTAAHVDTAAMPAGLGLGDPANAIQYSAWAFAAPARTSGDPASAARAVAALDYVAGQLNTSPAWRSGSPIINAQMLRAREAVRQVLGVAPAATSQQVVDTMAAVSLELAGNNRAAAVHTLATPIYTFGPEQTFALLANLPFIHTANIATAQAAGALEGRSCPLGCLR